MKFGHRIQGKITDYDDKGRGIFDMGTAAGPTSVELKNDEGETTGKYMMGKGRVAIPFSAVGDDVDATFIKRDSGVKIAKIETINTPGPDRVNAPCPHAGVCGGCLWQHLDYNAQLRLKKDMINRAFEKAGHEERIADVMPSIDQLYYRNRMDYVVGWLGQVGLKEYGSWNRYLDLSTCLLLNENAAEIMLIVRTLIKEFDLEPWDAKYHSGLMRYVVMRDGKNTNERMVMLVVSDASKISDEVRAVILERLGKFATSLLIGIQALPTDLSYVQSTIALKGNPWLEEEVNGIRYRLAPNSFLQTNTKMAAKLQDRVLNLASGTKKLLDLYCGLGFFGIAAAKKLDDVSVNGFELDAEAISLATHNATTNGVADRCSFASGPAEDLSWKDVDADTIILDPPRAGLHPRVVKTVLEKAPQTIVYVSCNFHHLVNELKEFKTKYRIESVEALDLFPQTPHVEVVTKLVRM
jgi:23S rRNA (uracil-5-)-methyltransferase RumA